MLLFKSFEIYPDKLIIDGVKLPKPDYLSFLQWLDYCNDCYKLAHHRPLDELERHIQEEAEALRSEQELEAIERIDQEWSDLVDSAIEKIDHLFDQMGGELCDEVVEIVKMIER